MKKRLLMHRRLLIIGVFLALCLTILVPASALAVGGTPIPGKSVSKSFNAVLTPSTMDATVIAPFPEYPWPVRDTPQTNVWPIVDIYSPGTPVTGWIVGGRSIYGTATGDVVGPFTFTYGGIVDLLQNGSIEGIVVIYTAQGGLYATAIGGIKTRIIEVYSMQPLIPKTLSAELSGLFAIEAGTGTGIYRTAKGTGRFIPNGGNPLILHLTPDQHVSSIEGSIKMYGTYSY